MVDGKGIPLYRFWQARTGMIRVCWGPTLDKLDAFGPLPAR